MIHSGHRSERQADPHALQALEHYVRKGRLGVEGWFARCDAQIFAALLSAQCARGRDGAVAEIGVHHGKSFIPLAISNQGKRCYAIDVFGSQHLNVDQSGSGDRARFLANLARHGVDPNGIVVDARLSMAVTSQDILRRVGTVRFFHIDGGHHLEAVVADLQLAASTLDGSGVIVLDDALRPEWPEVAMGMFAYLAQSPGIVPFALGFNKAYLCRSEHAGDYREVLLADPFLQMYLSKRYRVSREEILVFQHYPLPEWNLRQRLVHHLKLHHPDLAYALWRRSRAKAG